MAEILDLDLLQEFYPVVIRPNYYQFSVKQATVDPSAEPKDYKILVFGFKPSTAYRDWSVELVVIEEKDNKEVWHGSVTPLRQELWEKRLIWVAADLVKALPYAYNSAREKAEQVAAEETLEVHTGVESLDLETWPIEYQREVVAGFAVKNGYTHLFGDAGVGKSILAHNIGLHAAGGLHYLGFNAFLPPIKVLYLSLEMFYDEFRERHNKLLKHFPEVAGDNFNFICPEAFDITSPRDRFLLGNTVTKYGIKLAIVDSHTDWRGEVNLNDNAEVGAKIILPIIELMKQLDFSIILLDHTGWLGEQGRGKRPAGAKVVWNKTSIGIFMEETGEENLTKISFKKWRNTARRKPRPISLRYDPETYLIARSTETDLMTLCEQLGLSNKSGVKSGEITRGIMELTGLHERQAKTKKADAIRAGLLCKRKGMIYLGQGEAGVDMSKAKPIDIEDI
jgi:hypothetical protein